MVKTEVYHSGLDIKSLLINFSTFLFFIVPFEIYFYPEYVKEECIVVVVGFAIAYMAPPYGFLRPHPYSDMPSNKPFAPRMEFSATAIKQP